MVLTEGRVSRETHIYIYVIRHLPLGSPPLRRYGNACRLPLGAPPPPLRRYGPPPSCPSGSSWPPWVGQKPHRSAPERAQAGTSQIYGSGPLRSEAKVSSRLGESIVFNSSPSSGLDPKMNLLLSKTSFWVTFAEPLGGPRG